MSDREQEGFELPATFEFLVANLQMQAQVQLGLVRLDPSSDPPQPNLPLARHAIDMLAMLREKTKGNLSWPEQRDLENALTELRIQFVRASAAPPANAVEEAGPVS